MPTLFGRRYMRGPQQVGRTEKILGLVILLLVAGVVGLFVAALTGPQTPTDAADQQLYALAEESRPAAPAISDAGGQPSSADDAVLLRQLAPAGWELLEPIERFGPDELYIKIDGQAAAYLHHGFVELVFASYAREDDPERALDLYWYRMEQPAGASALYGAERPPEVGTLSLGAEGYQVGGAVFFWQGVNYVQVLPSGLEAADAAAVLELARRLAERIE